MLGISEEQKTNWIPVKGTRARAVRDEGGKWAETFRV